MIASTCNASSTTRPQNPYSASNGWARTQQGSRRSRMGSAHSRYLPLFSLNTLTSLQIFLNLGSTVYLLWSSFSMAKDANGRCDPTATPTRGLSTDLDALRPRSFELDKTLFCFAQSRGRFTLVDIDIYVARTSGLYAPFRDHAVYQSGL